MTKTTVLSLKVVGSTRRYAFQFCSTGCRDKYRAYLESGSSGWKRPVEDVEVPLSEYGDEVCDECGVKFTRWTRKGLERAIARKKESIEYYRENGETGRIARLEARLRKLKTIMETL